MGSTNTRKDEITKVTNVGSQITTGGDLTLVSGGDQRYQVAKLESGNNLTLQSGGAITFEGVKDLDKESHEKNDSDLAWTSMSGKGRTDETLRQSQLTAQGNLVIKAVDGLHIDVKQIDQNTVSQTIDAMVKADPQLAWLKDAEKRGDVDWRQVKEMHESFKYSHSGLGQGAMLAIIIIVTVLTAGAASAAVGAATSASAGTTMAAATAATATTAGTAAGLGNMMATAVLTSMASTGAVSVINNKGDIGAAFKDTFSSNSLKNAAIAGFTAGAMNYADSNWFQSPSGATNGGSQVTSAGPIQNPGYSSDMLSWSNAEQTVLRSGTHALINSGISTAINGGSLGQNLGGALVGEGLDLAAAAGNRGVGDLAKQLHADPGTAQTMLLHAMLGGLISVAKGQNFTSGAIAGGVAEGLTPIANGLLAQYASDQFAASDLSQQGSEKKIATAQIIGLLSASLAGGDAGTGSMIGGYGQKYNQQFHALEAFAAAYARAHPSAGKGGGNPDADTAALDPTSGFGNPGGPDGTSSKNPFSQSALWAAAIMGGAAGRFGATFGTALGEALPAFGSMLSEVGEGAAAGIRAGTAEGGATGASEGASIDAAGGAEGNAATKLSQGEQRAVKKINNILNNFKDSDITGTLKDMAGEPVPKGDGTYWDHLKEMDDTLRGLRNHAETLKGISDPVAQGARQRALDTIERVESALRGAGI